MEDREEELKKIIDPADYHANQLKIKRQSSLKPEARGRA